MELLDSRLVELVKNHLEISISTDISNFENVDCTIYNESTADGYDVYVITNDPRNVSVCEEVYYYDHDLADQFHEQMRYGDRTFYVDGDIYDDCYFEDKLIELSLYDFVIGCQMIFDKIDVLNKKQVDDFQKGLTWFRVNNPEAYYVLLD